MSVLDDYAEQRRAEAAQDAPDEQHNDLQGFGQALGTITLVGSILALPATAGLSIIGIVAGCLLLAGHQVETETLAAIAEAPDQAARNSALASGCSTILIGGLLAIGLVLLMTYFLNGGKL